MEVDDILQRLGSFCVVCRKKGFHPGVDLFRRAGAVPAYFIRQLLIITDIEPRLEAVGRPRLQQPVNLFDKRLGKFILCPVYDQVNAPEVVGGLDDIVDIDTFICNAD